MAAGQARRLCGETFSRRLACVSWFVSPALFVRGGGDCCCLSSLQAPLSLRAVRKVRASQALFAHKIKRCAIQRAETAPGCVWNVVATSSAECDCCSSLLSGRNFLVIQSKQSNRYSSGCFPSSSSSSFSSSSPIFSFYRSRPPVGPILSKLDTNINQRQRHISNHISCMCSTRHMHKQNRTFPQPKTSFNHIHKQTSFTIIPFYYTHRYY